MWLAQSSNWIWLAVTLTALLAGGYLLMKLFRYEVGQFVQRAMRGRSLDPAMVQWSEELSRGVRLAISALVAILMTFFVLRAMNHPAVADWNTTAVLDWLMARGVRIVLVLVGAFIAIKVIHIFVSNLGLLIRPADNSAGALIEREKRAQTITIVLRNFLTVLVITVAVLMLLSELGVNTTPLLTGLGVIGVALGFGAQQLVGDLIAGFFHIFENQIRVGDVAVINGTGGLVEEIRLRTTVLRSQDGTVHVFRNGTIQTLSNMTKDYSFFVLDLGVAYREDTDRVCEVVKKVGEEMQQDENFGPAILEPVEVLGVESFGDSAVVIRFRIKTLPIKQWLVGREFRRRLKYRLDQEGIEIPFPHRTIYFGEASKPFRVEVDPDPQAHTSAQDVKQKQPGR